MNHPRTRLLAAAACLVVAAPVATAATASSGPIAHTATATCPGANSPTYNSAGKGTGYFNKLVVTGLSCASGKKLMHAHHSCRAKHGIRGKCPHVNGYSCTEKRNAIPTEFNSRVTCKNGSRKVVYYYTQNT